MGVETGTEVVVVLDLCVGSGIGAGNHVGAGNSAGCSLESEAGGIGRSVETAGVRMTTDLRAPADVEGGTVDLAIAERLWCSSMLVWGTSGRFRSKKMRIFLKHN